MSKSIPNSVLIIRRRPWHLWAVGVSCLLWSLMSVAGYILTVTGNQRRLAGLSPDIMKLVSSLPWWAANARTVAIFTAPIAAILLLRRSRHAFVAFLILILAFAVGTVGEEVAGLPASMRSGAVPVTKIVNWAIMIGMIAYSHWLRLRRTLQ